MTGIVVIVLFSVVSYSDGAASSLFNEVDALLKKRLEANGNGRYFLVGEARVRLSARLPVFYQRRNYEPAWTDDYGLLPHTGELIAAIGNAPREGLRPTDYRFPQIERLLRIVRRNKTRQELVQPQLLVDLELLTTNAFLTYGYHLLYGKVNPKVFHSEWSVKRADYGLALVLQDALDRNRIAQALRDLPPIRQEYAWLRKALADYRRIAAKGGWSVVPEGPLLKEGDRDPRVPALRSRLAATGDTNAGKARRSVRPTADDRFDSDLKRALRKFQKRHGLSPDGIAGPSTVAALAVPVEDRIRRIEVNMERWRWLPRNFEDRYIRVNIADYKLNIVNDGKPILTMRVIVGKPHRQTPVLNDRITDVVFNPNWYIPPTIVQNDILPRIRENPNYLREMNMKVFQSLDGESWEIDPNTIDWNKPENEEPPLQIRQDPGPDNFLGRFKFILSNRLDVYLHDTSFRERFNGSMRNLSSGCVRVEKPKKLADYLLKGYTDWDGEKTTAAIASGVPRKITLPDPFPVYILYWTAWVGRDQNVQFRTDIYELDEQIAKALRQ
ncbi:MAG: L,D-transpeptidase family protein [Proteobacteria bacterium]|nr:L,D-transpeptidase family protein [Pseudomonadota bacterium]